MREILKGVWEILRQPCVSAEGTRRCQTRECWHLSLMTNSGFHMSLMDWMLRELPSASKRFKMVILSLFRQNACRRTCAVLSTLEDCWTEQLSSS
eukprot:5965160-Amphidinium_carterae.1